MQTCSIGHMHAYRYMCACRPHSNSLPQPTHHPVRSYRRWCSCRVAGTLPYMHTHTAPHLCTYTNALSQAWWLVLMPSRFKIRTQAHGTSYPHSTTILSMRQAWCPPCRWSLRSALRSSSHRWCRAQSRRGRSRSLARRCRCACSCAHGITCLHAWEWVPPWQLSAHTGTYKVYGSVCVCDVAVPRICHTCQAHTGTHKLYGSVCV